MLENIRTRICWWLVTHVVLDVWFPKPVSDKIWNWSYQNESP